MNIVACMKRVPKTELQPRVGPNGKHIDSTDVPYMVSFYDAIAVEEAIRLKEKLGGEVTVLTLGPSAASQEVRECLAKGVDKGVLLVDEDWSSRDALSTAKALKTKLMELGAELVIMGRVATDRDQGAVGPMLATLLGWACVTDVVELRIEAGKGTAKREADGGLEEFSFELPVVISCQKDLNEPRYAGLKGIMAAKKKPLEESPAEASTTQTEVLGVALPAPRKEGRIVGQGTDAVPALIDALRNEAKVF